MMEADETSPPHISLDRLLSYHQSEVDEQERDRIEEHFLRCRACTERSIDLARFLRPEEEEDSETASAATMRELLAPAGADRRRERRRAEPLRSERSRRFAGSKRPLAIAAILAVAFPLFGWLSARQQLAHLLEAEPNVPIASLEAAAFRREAWRPAPPAAPIPAGALLILLPELGPEAVDHTITILTQSGDPIWSNSTLRPTELGQFHLRLPRNLPPGTEYRLRIAYPRLGHVEEFLIRITAPGPR